MVVLQVLLFGKLDKGYVVFLSCFSQPHVNLQLPQSKKNKQTTKKKKTKNEERKRIQKTKNKKEQFDKNKIGEQKASICSYLGMRF